MAEQNIPQAAAFSAKHQIDRKYQEARHPDKALLFLYPK